jgi:tetrapyrrole methylase family protein/MazG family protein
MAGKVTVVGLGPGEPGLLTLGALEALEKADSVLVRTAKHPTVACLGEKGIKYEALDRFYEDAENFASVYRKITDYVVNKGRGSWVCYAVPGDPSVGEATTRSIRDACHENGLDFEIINGTSFLEPLFSALMVDPFDGVSILDATTLQLSELTPWKGTILCQVYNRMVASDVKLKLLEAYPPEHSAWIANGAGSGSTVIRQISLYQLDHEETPLDHLASVYIPPVQGIEPGMSPVTGGRLPALVNVMARLRSKTDGCPWDTEQDHKSLRPYVIEEAFEVLEAIDSGMMDKLVEELGDLLLQVVFHSQIGAENGDFTIDDVINEIVAKLIRRHPHVFGDVQVEDAEGVLINWEKIKRGEKGNIDRKSVLDGIPVDLPALMKASKIQGKAAKVGFDWDHADDALEKVWEESAEFRQAYMSGDKDKIEDEMGDLFFAIVNVARFFDINPEFALRRTVDKFQHRFRYIEEIAEKTGKSLEQMTLQEMDALWNEAKLLPDGIRR